MSFMEEIFKIAQEPSDFRTRLEQLVSKASEADMEKPVEFAAHGAEANYYTAKPLDYHAIQLQVHKDGTSNLVDIFSFLLNRGAVFSYCEHKHLHVYHDDVDKSMVDNGEWIIASKREGEEEFVVNVFAHEDFVREFGLRFEETKEAKTYPVRRNVAPDLLDDDEDEDDFYGEEDDD